MYMYAMDENKNNQTTSGTRNTGRHKDGLMTECGIRKTNFGKN